jgi:hypothetical protein
LKDKPVKIMRLLCTALLGLALAPLVSAEAAQATEFLPAGLLISCTVSEPNFSMKTAQIGDPILCSLRTNIMGRITLPRGSYLTGRLVSGEAPGHFVGKGTLGFEFDRMVLGGKGSLGVSTKLIAAPKNRISPDGTLHGRGHPKRDVIGWMIPVLWPIKIATLPARGPYPALHGETKLTFRLMEDIELPDLAPPTHLARDILRPQEVRYVPEPRPQVIQQVVYVNPPRPRTVVYYAPPPRVEYYPVPAPPRIYSYPYAYR